MPSGAEMITADLRDRLSRGEWAVGAQIPAIAQLCEHYQSSTATMRRAQGPLISQGWLRTHQGRGVFVDALPPPPAAGEKSQQAAVTSALAAIDTAMAALADARRTLSQSSDPRRM